MYDYRNALHMRQQERRRRERVRSMIVALVAVAVMLLLYAAAGTLDLEDRTQGLGASMLPSEEWRVYAAE